jgi:hypothetical protein
MWNTVIIGLLQLLVLLIIYPYGIVTMITVFISINIGWILVWHYFVKREINLSLRYALKDILPFAFIAFITMGITYFITQGIHNLYILLCSKILIAATIYCLFMLLTKATVFKESIQYIFKKK